jgi:CheY-like chemotaxis protein
MGDRRHDGHWQSDSQHDHSHLGKPNPFHGDKIVRRGCRNQLPSPTNRHVSDWATQVGKTVEAARQFAPDVVLMDLRMPGIDGVAATRAIMSLSDPPQVLILTTFDLDEYVHACLRAGASGFLLKDTDPLGKLGARDRLQAVILADESGLVRPGPG